MKKQYKMTMLIGMILVLQTLCMVYFANQKQGYFVDELWSYGLANSYYHPHVYSDDALEGVWVSGDYFREYLEVSETERFCYDSVIYNQTQDFHPPLFYIVLHTICSMFTDTFSKWYGIIPNICYFIITNILLYYLSKRIYKNSWVAIIPPLFYGFSAGAISNVIYIRMYALMMVWILATLNMHCKWILVKKCTKKELLGLIAISYCGYMSHYYFFIFAFLISVFYFMYLCLTSKKKNEIVQYVTAMMISLILVLITFPTAYMKLFFGQRGSEAVHNFFDMDIFAVNVKRYWEIIGRGLLANCQNIILLGCFIILIILFFNKFIICVRGNFDKISGVFRLRVYRPQIIEKEYVYNQYIVAVFLIFCTTMLYVLVVAKVSPYQTDRYVFSVYPVIMFLIIYFLKTLLELCGFHKIFAVGVIVLIFGVLSMKGITGKFINYIYSEGEINVEISKKYAGSDCIYISGDYYKLVGNALELKNMERVHTLVPWKLEKITTLIDSSKSHIIVYLDEGLKQDETIQRLLDLTGFEQYEELFQSRCFAYCLYR